MDNGVKVDRVAPTVEGANSGRGYAECAARESGKRALMDVVRRLRREADQIEALARAIPDNFPADADAGLWLLTSFHKR